MSSLMIRFYATQDGSGEDELKTAMTIPLPIFKIMAKHIPDQVLRFIYDPQHPENGSTAVNMHTIVSTINNILQEIEAERRVGSLDGVMAEFVFLPDEPQPGQGTTQEEMEKVKVVFSVE
jgi:hypothetical protein